MVAAFQAKTISDMIISMEFQRPKLTPVHIQWDLGIENSDQGYIQILYRGQT